MKEVSLPKYLQHIDKLAATFEVKNDAKIKDLINASKLVVSSDLNSEIELLQDKDECDPEYGENILKKFIKKICSRVDYTQKKILAKISVSIAQINSGSVEAVFILLINCLQELEEDTFDVLKQILVIIDKLIEIKTDAVKLVIEMVIESLGGIMKSWEEKNCRYDYPGFLHSLFKYSIDIITWTPKKKIKQLIEHIFDIFTSIPWFRCTCACKGIFAQSAEEEHGGNQVGEKPILIKRTK